MKPKILSALVSFSFFLGVAWATPVSDHGQLSVVDGQVVDKNGNPPQLRGMSLFWNIWDGGFYNSAAVNELANNWGADLIRAAIANKDVSQTKSMIDYAIAAGIYIIVDNHSHKAHLETDATKEYFRQISDYVKGKGNPPNVIYEIYNEPVYNDGSTDNAGAGITSWATIKTFAEAVIPTIRGNDPNNLIVVGTTFFSQGLGGANSSRINATNIAYAFHFYTSAPSHENLMYTARAATCWKLPIFITEWGTSTSDGGQQQQPIDWDLTYRWMSMVEGLKLSWANWALGNKNETSSAISGGSNPPWNLTNSGTYVRNLIYNLGRGQAATGISSASTACPSSSSGGVNRLGGGWAGNRIEGEGYLTGTGSTDVADPSVSNSYYLGGFSENATMTYFVDSDTTRIFNLFIALSSLTGTANYTFKIDGVPYTGIVPNTGSPSFFDRTKHHMTLTKGRHDIEVSFTNVDPSVGFDYFQFAIPDSVDSVAYEIEAPIRSLKEQGLEYRWTRDGLVIGRAGNTGISVVSLYAMNGRRLKVWRMGNEGSSVKITRDQLPNEGLLLLVLKSQAGMKTIKLPIVR